MRADWARESGGMKVEKVGVSGVAIRARDRHGIGGSCASEQILDAAATLIADAGLESVSVAAIAR